jgi:hypothetical protein
MEEEPKLSFESLSWLHGETALEVDRGRQQFRVTTEPTMEA